MIVAAVAEQNSAYWLLIQKNLSHERFFLYIWYLKFIRKLQAGVIAEFELFRPV